jgi:ADP-ribosylation factor-like protein 2
LSLEEISERLGLKDIKTHHCHVMACSAVSKDGAVELMNGMDWIVGDIGNRVYIYD